MIGRQLAVTLWQGKEGSVEKCSLRAYFIKEKKEQYILHDLSKHEIEYFIWILAEARDKMKYTEDEPPLLR